MGSSPALEEPAPSVPSSPTVTTQEQKTSSERKNKRDINTSQLAQSAEHVKILKVQFHKSTED